MEKQKQKGKIILFIGLPGSGKSTESRKRVEDGQTMRVSRDDIRNMLFQRWKGRKEQIVTDTEKAAVQSAVTNGYNIIIDDTNLNPSTQQAWKDLANKLGVPLLEENFTTPVDECIVRDSLRTGRSHVGRPIIENMALKYARLPPIPADQKVVIFDVDGTIADCSARKQYLNLCKSCGETEEFHKEPAENTCEEFIPGKKDHKIFYEKVSEDLPIWPVINWLRSCHAAGYVVLIVSGRPTDVAGDGTTGWLEVNGVPYRHIFMRAAGDFRDDRIVKQEILDKILNWITKDQILFTVDDRPRVIRMWKENGLRCFDVGPGIEF